MPDEPMELELARLKLEESKQETIRHDRRWSAFEKIGIATLAILAAIPPLIFQNQTNNKVNEIKAEQSNIMARVYDVQTHSRAAVGVPPPPPVKEP